MRKLERLLREHAMLLDAIQAAETRADLEALRDREVKVAIALREEERYS